MDEIVRRRRLSGRDAARVEAYRRSPRSCRGSACRWRTRLAARGRERLAAMESRYQDEAVRGLDPVDQLVQVSRWVGAETSLAVWGGGNTSVKLAEPDLLGARPGPAGEGERLGSQERDAPGLSRRAPPGGARAPRARRHGRPGDGRLSRALSPGPGSPRPSIETLLHGFLDAEAVIHTHADAIVGLTNNERGRAASRTCSARRPCGCRTGGPASGCRRRCGRPSGRGRRRGRSSSRSTGSARGARRSRTPTSRPSAWSRGRRAGSGTRPEAAGCSGPPW